MECNKDEALRAKEIAERKVSEKDYLGAKRFALKAQNLYPSLDGLLQTLSTIDVYVSAENRISGEADWYSILGVDPRADDEMVRKQYRKLALMLHPDKNKCKGADGAFKLVSEAWSLLSDKAKRLAYNQRRSSRGIGPNFPNHSGVQSYQPTANGFQNPRNATPDARATAKVTRVEPSSFHPANQKPATFWTICNRCKTQFEYLRIYLNQMLLCPNCREAFMAVEKAPPPSVLKSPNNFTSHQQNLNSRHQTAKRDPFSSSDHRNSPNSQSFGWDSLSRTAGVTSRNPSAQAASVVQQAQGRVKRRLEESQEWDASRRMANPTLKAERNFKKARAEEFHTNRSYSNGWANQAGMGTGTGIRSSCDSVGANFDTLRTSGITGCYNTANKMLTTFEVRNALKTKAQTVIYKKFKDWSSETEAKEKSKEKENRTMRPENKASSDENELKKNSGSADVEETTDHSDVENHEPMIINVPDSDFHNFDLDRSENSFADDQVWAAYDDDDGMPRFYARIQKVISFNPFKMKISWLNSRSNSELGPMDWIGSGFTKTCGDFRTGRYEFADTLNSFSHMVQFTKGARGVIRIFPEKGDVWALYRNWSPDWNENTPDEVIHKYEMVEVLDDFTDEQGVTVAPLIKEAGFRAVFRRSTDQNDARKIPLEEMFRFSHQVPNYLLTGQEADNAPLGCRELDPAATPFELLQENMEEIKEASERENEKTERSEEKS